MINKLSEMPDEVFDFVHECIDEGFYPSYEDFKNRFGKEYKKWSEYMPDDRYEVDNEIEDEEFISSPRTLHDEYKDLGLDFKRDFL